jgi:hypothetical protein
MCKFQVLLPSVIFVASIGAGSAWSDTCESVYQNATRNYVFSQNNWSYLNSVYDNQCTTTGDRQSTTWNSSMNILADALPVSMTGNASTSEDKMTNFCHYYHGVTSEQKQNILETDSVVVEALSNFNTCVQIESQAHVTITHKFANPDSIVFNFAFNGGGTTFLDVEGVSTGGNIVCTSSGGTDGAPSTLDQTSHFSAKDNFTILCKRTPIPGANGGAQYAATSIAIATNIDSYTISIPSDSIYSNDLASDATTKINDLTANLNAATANSANLTQQLQTLSSSINNQKVALTHVIVAWANPGGGTYFACGTPPATIQKVVCPDPHVYYNILETNAVGGGSCGTAHLVAVCVTR